jgi:hypothetical protein
MIVNTLRDCAVMSECIANIRNYTFSQRPPVDLAAMPLLTAESSMLVGPTASSVSERAEEDRPDDICVLPLDKASCQK